MQLVFQHITKKPGDRCPACYSTDDRSKPKGILVKTGKAGWGVKCTVCKYRVLIKKIKRKKRDLYK